jgi:hypothetical protein
MHQLYQQAMAETTAVTCCSVSHSRSVRGRYRRASNLGKTRLEGQGRKFLGCRPDSANILKICWRHGMHSIAAPERHSMASSARSIMLSVYLVGCWIGRSPGFLLAGSPQFSSGRFRASSSSLAMSALPFTSSSRAGMKGAIRGSFIMPGAKSDVVVIKPFDAPSR